MAVDVIRAAASLSTHGSSRGGIWAALAVATAVAMTIVHVAQLQLLILPSGLFKTAHICFAVVIVTLSLLEATGTSTAHRLLAAAAAIFATAATAYIFLEYEALVTMRAIFANRLDTATGILLLVAALYATWRKWGWAIPLIAILALLYGAFGYLLPGELLFHGGISVQRLVSYATIPFFQGLLGGLTELSAGTIFVFLLFGAALTVTGGIEFIVELARRVGGRARSGPALVAVISSGFMGMISGSTVANVASTGAMTIPMMKRFGFRPEFAGAVEATASMGGQYTPPVMGLAAFLIVGLTGIPYSEVMAAAIIPALVYCLYLMVAVHIQAAKAGIDARLSDPAEDNSLAQETSWSLALRHAHLIAGIALLVYLLFTQMPPGPAALYATGFMLAADVVKRLFGRGLSLRVKIRDALRVILGALEAGGRAGAQVAVILAVIGILVEILTVTGFAQKLSSSMLALSDGRLWTLCVIAATASLVFGLGVPTPAAYLLVALLGAPALIELGVPTLTAHMFVFYFANLSAITPPVAVAALVAANIAKASFMRTALTSIRLGLPAFLLPFLFVATPELLALEGGPIEWAFFGIVALAGVTAFNMAVEGYALGPLEPVPRLLLLPAAFGLLVPGLWPTVIGMALLVLVLGAQTLQLRNKRMALHRSATVR